jgi:plastocyanin
MAETHAVAIQGMAFDPDPVKGAAGDTVTWTNQDAMTHTVTADDGSFDSGPLNQGDTFSHAFGAAGSFGYHCEIHPFMTGTVVVA